MLNEVGDSSSCLFGKQRNVIKGNSLDNYLRLGNNLVVISLGSFYLKIEGNVSQCQSKILYEKCTNNFSFSSKLSGLRSGLFGGHRRIPKRRPLTLFCFKSNMWWYFLSSPSIFSHWTTKHPPHGAPWIFRGSSCRSLTSSASSHEYCVQTITTKSQRVFNDVLDILDKQTAWLSFRQWCEVFECWWSSRQSSVALSDGM